VATAAGIVAVLAISSQPTGRLGDSSAAPVSGSATAEESSAPPGGEFPIFQLYTASPIELPFDPYYEVALEAAKLVQASVKAELPKVWEQSVEQQEFIAQCMADQGFEYEPETYQSAEDMPWNDREQLLKGGLSLAALPDTLEEVERVGYGVDDPTDAPSAGVTANQAYREGLSETEGQAYDEALFGGTSGSVGEGGEALEPVAEQAFEASCLGQAEAAHPTPALPEEADEALQTLSGLIMPLILEDSAAMGPIAIVGDAWYPDDIYPFEQDSRWTELNADYAACFADKSQDLPYQDIVAGIHDPAKLAQMVSADGSELTVPFPLEEDYDEKLNPLVGSPGQIEVAVADFQCRAKVDVVNRYAPIVADAQAHYLDNPVSRADLDNMKAGLEKLIAAR
jgi:hypothetical protein